MPLRDMDREQMWLLPPTLDELLPSDHPARFVAEFVDALEREDWAELGVAIDGDPLGAPAYHPRALLSVWLYGFMTGVRSSRKLEAACRDQIPYLWLTGWQRPDHNTLWRFYQAHRQSMRTLFKRTVRVALTMDLVDLALQAVDGTKVGANAGRGKSYDAEGLGRLLEQVERAIKDLESRNESGEEGDVARLHADLRDQKTLRDRVREAIDRLALKPRQRHINLTDQDARLMKTRRGAMPSFNAQAMVSPIAVPGQGAGMLITAADVCANPDDHAELVPMLEQAEEMTGVKAELTLADAGYHSGNNLKACSRDGRRVLMPDPKRRHRGGQYHKDRFKYDEDHDSFTCPEGQILRFSRYMQANIARVRLYRTRRGVCQSCPAFGVCTVDVVHGRAVTIGPHEETLRSYRALTATEEAKAIRRRRGQLIEPVFGIIKEQMGMRRFALRGLMNVAAEWTMMVAAFNLRTLWRIWRVQRPAY